MTTEATMDGLSTDELGDRICELPAHLAAAQYRWLRLLSAFDKRNGWAVWGVRSCAHWLSWRCGLDLRSAREKVRVARALDDLPALCEAFGRGEVGYSKVRAITRIATPQTEDELLTIARHGTTQHVEKIVRSYRRCVPAELDDANDRHDKRYLDWSYDDDGSVVIRARLDPEEGALVIEALRKVQDEVRDVRRASDATPDGSAEPSFDGADALVEIARRELGGQKASGSSANRYTVMLHVDASALAGGDGVCHVDGGSALTAETMRRLTCDGSLVTLLEDGEGNTLSVGRKTRTIPASIRRVLLNRDGGCRFPGCTHRAFVDGHHIEHWSRGGETSLANLVLLCSFHHRLVHEGAVRLRAEADGRFAFTLTDGRVVETAALSVDPGAIERRNAELGLRIAASTAVPQWTRETCDYGVAVEGLLRRNGIRIDEVGSAEPSAYGHGCQAPVRRLGLPRVSNR